MEKGKILYFGVFIMVVVAFIFHVTAMGHNHWKKANLRDNATASIGSRDSISIGLFTQCRTSNDSRGETCFPNLFKNNISCIGDCLSKIQGQSCSCDYLPSTKGIAACAIIASIFLGLAIIILFIHSINTSETRSIGLILGLFPLILLLFAFIFILITLILVGSYLSRDIMSLINQSNFGNTDIPTLRTMARDQYKVRVDWSTGLEIISLFFTFVSLVLYSAFVFKFGRSS